MADQVEDAVTDAVIKALDSYPGVREACIRLVRVVTPRDTEEESDRLIGEDIRDRYGKTIAGDLTLAVDWVRVGRHYRDAARDECDGADR